MTNQTLEEREASPIIHLKKLNNWIEDCRSRYNGDAYHHQRCRKFSFPARLICADCYEVSLDEVLADDAPFDICSCQFALHCSWSTEALARRALANVSALLPPGGIFIRTMPDANVIVKKLREAKGLAFGNSVHWIRFDEDYFEKKFKCSSPYAIKYKFHLEYDLELIFVKNGHEFVQEYLKKPEYIELMRRLGALGDGNQDQSTLSSDEWEVAYLYLAFVLKKRGQPDRTKTNGKRDKGKMDI
ncbi:hypothetical protein MANES_06G031600v8 [Manihot esculenta]|uniref:mRNA (guanine-N(7))-methyltransferase n=2 Tax=Manihot esculenta TaxID=3983 RepID=A0A2C9VPK7_MANES|nr:hypothetical protein MANES_06G031600v8 [Manihot esculenta]OAY46834.1 hypothetical protein MANES_06G031600v8 [Manihot esculenta]